MRKTRDQKGLTLLEVLVSVAIFIMMWLAVAASITGSGYLSSFVKHKAQAIYLARQLLENERRAAFAGAVPPFVVQPPSQTFFLDTKGTTTANDDITQCNVIITTTYPDTYPNDQRKNVRVEVNWTEKILGGSIVIREYCTSDIQPQLT